MNMVRTVFIMCACLVAAVSISPGKHKNEAELYATKPSEPKLIYSKHIAPIIASQCSLCHGDWREGLVKGFDTVTYDALMDGGYNGKFIIPGNAQDSPLVQYIEGRRQPRMPWNDAPLPVEMIAMIRRWIDEGAVVDDRSRREYEITIPEIQVEKDTGSFKDDLEISCRPNVKSHLRITVTDEASGKIILRDWRDGEPGQWTVWNAIPSDNNRPRSVRVSLYISPENPGDVSPGPEGTIFLVNTGNDRDLDRLRAAQRQNIFKPNPAIPPGDTSGRFTVNLDAASDVRLTIWPKQPKNAPATFEQLFRDIAAGTREFPWNLKSRVGAPVDKGFYVGRLDIKTRGAPAREMHLAELIRVGFL